MHRSRPITPFQQPFVDAANALVLPLPPPPPDDAHDDGGDALLLLPTSETASPSPSLLRERSKAVVSTPAPAPSVACATTTTIVGAPLAADGAVAAPPPYTVVLQNWYEPQHTVGSHSDDEEVRVWCDNDSSTMSTYHCSCYSSTHESTLTHESCEIKEAP
jgi:hypothetical protein